MYIGLSCRTCHLFFTLLMLFEFMHLKKSGRKDKAILTAILEIKIITFRYKIFPKLVVNNR